MEGVRAEGNFNQRGQDVSGQSVRVAVVSDDISVSVNCCADGAGEWNRAWGFATVATLES
jgi:hypothetical protein